MSDALERRLFEANPDGLWLFDDRGVTTWANATMARILGREHDEMVGLPVRETMDEQGSRDFDQALAGMLATGEGAENIDAYFVRPDGTAVWGLVSFTAVHDDDGSRIGWLHRVTPYTERKNLYEALVEREQQLATAQAIAHVGSWEWDVVADRVVWSDEMCRIFGVPVGTTPTLETYLARIHPDDRARAEDRVRHGSGTGEEYAFDHRIVRPDGEVRWVQGRGVVELGPDGTAVRMSGTAQDVSELRAADELAQEASRRLFLLQQMAMAANRARTLHEALVMASTGVPEHTSWATVCAYRYDEAGRTADVVDLRGPALTVAPDPELAEQARQARAIRVGEPSERSETHSLVAMPVLLADEVVCVVELFADERPPDENSYQLMTQIGHQLSVVAERERNATQLAEARDEAMEASRLKSEFLATMSHEIRTPMNGVIGLADLLMRTDLNEHQLRLTENLQNAGLTLLGIINDILDLSKIESGKLELEVAEFDVRAVFDQVATVLSGPAHEKGLELVVACHPDVPVLLRGDAVRFGQVISNLGSNAVKFTDAGEVVIEARIEGQGERDVVLRVDVTDTGVGIGPGDRERLFEAFTQADPSTTRRHGGTGLGLTISRQLVDALGGEVWVTSEPGAGSTFSFTARFGDVAGAADPRLDVPLPLRGRRVLVVDDNETNRLILDDQLAAWHMRPALAACADEALTALRAAAAERDPFDVALVDLNMPEVDGLQLARWVRADADLAGVQLVLLSSSLTTRQEASDAGFVLTLSKPVRQVELHGALVGVLAPQSAVHRLAADRAAEPALGARVLVVEDNPVNQLVATGLLEHLGCTVDLADDGLEAVEKLAPGHGYAVVLMDCRMPRLDGFDATRRIREREIGPRVPIIAMTASALEGERERCLEAGMDDYLTKPVDSAELTRVLRAWVEGPTAEVLSLPTGRPKPPAGGSRVDPALLLGVLDSERVRILEGLAKDGTTFFERTAASFMGRVGGQVLAIHEAVTTDDADALLTSAHQLKGSALNLGLPRVAQAAARLEAIGAAGTTSGSAGLLDDLTTEVDIAVSALQQATARPR